MIGAALHAQAELIVLSITRTPMPPGIEYHANTCMSLSFVSILTHFGVFLVLGNREATGDGHRGSLCTGFYGSIAVFDGEQPLNHTLMTGARREHTDTNVKLWCIQPQHSLA